MQGVLKRFYTDDFSTYSEVLPYDKHVITKAKTHLVESDNHRTRHWLGRMRRRTCMVTKSIEMLHLSVLLIAHYHTNGSILDILDLKSLLV